MQKAAADASGGRPPNRDRDLRFRCAFGLGKRRGGSSRFHPSGCRCPSSFKIRFFCCMSQLEWFVVVAYNFKRTMVPQLPRHALKERFGPRHFASKAE